MMRTILRNVTIVALSLFGFQTVFANNVVVSNISLTGQDAADNFTFVQFNITWDNSWRDPGNHDAAWVFVKYSTDGGATWRHASLDISGHIAPGDSKIDTPSDSMGVFIYRDAVGSGTNIWDGVKLKWDYGADSVSDDATVLVKVIAIEMVYIPQASFSVGSGGSENGHFFCSWRKQSVFNHFGSSNTCWYDTRRTFLFVQWRSNGPHSGRFSKRLQRVLHDEV